MSIAAKGFISFFILSLFFALEAKAERPEASNPYNYIAGGGNIAFGKGGAAYLPISVLQGLKNGQLSPVMQFILINGVMSKCIKNVLKTVPARRDSFKTANAKFTAGYCKIRKCFQESMVLGTLSQMSSNPAYGGSEDAGERQGAQTMALVLAQAFSKEDDCDPGSNSSGFDTAILQVIGN